MRQFTTLPLLLSGTLAAFCFLPVPTFAQALPPASAATVVAADSRLEMLWDEGTHTEGVAVAPDGTVYFCDVTPSSAGDTLGAGHIYRFDPRARKVTVFRSPAGQADGMKFDRMGRMIVAESADGGGRRLTRTDLTTGKSEIIAARYKMRPLNSPNDLALDPQGVIYFTDPRYDGKEPIEQPTQGVYRLDADNSPRLLIAGLSPNGLAITPDGRTLYVSDHNLGVTDQSADPDVPRQKRMRLLAFDLLPGGRARLRQTVVDFGDEDGPDGIALDSSGNLYAAMRSQSRVGVRVFSPDGKEIDFLPTPELPTNVAFGRGSDNKTLYITAGKSLYRIRMQIAGYTPGESR